MKHSLIFSLDGRDEIVNNIVSNTYVGHLRTQKFSDGELCVDFLDSVRGKRVFIVSSPNNSDEIMKLNLAIDAAKRGAAKEIIPILPYFPYARQDKKDQSRGPIGAKILAEMIENRGATSVIAFDLHADQIQGFFNIPVIHLEGRNVFDDYINDLIVNEDDSNFVLCGPDAGSGKRVKRMRDQIQNKFGHSLNYVMLDKTRKAVNVIDEMIIIGDVNGKDVIILDDMVDTGGTLCKAAEVLMENGAKSVRAIISHGVLSGPAMERIGESVLKELVISDSLAKKESLELCEEDYSEDKCTDIINGCNKIKIISVTRQIGLAVKAIITEASYESLRGENK